MYVLGFNFIFCCIFCKPNLFVDMTHSTCTSLSIEVFDPDQDEVK